MIFMVIGTSVILTLRMAAGITNALIVLIRVEDYYNSLELAE